MDKSILSEIRQKVQPTDTLYILGDFAWGNATEVRALLHQIPGTKILVYGNHDQVIRKNVDIQRMFASVHEYLEITYNGTLVVMLHYPIMEWNRIHRGAVHVHGHLHTNPSNVPGKILNICWDNHQRILTMDDVLDMTAKLPIRTHH